MTRALMLDIPEELNRAVEQEAARTGQSPEQVVLGWIRQRAPLQQRGTVDAIMPSLGAWSMTPEERQRIEQMIEEERLMEDGRG